MSKKPSSRKSAAAVTQANAAAPAQGESFFNEAGATPTPANGAAPAAVSPGTGPGASKEAGPTVLKRKRSYKPRAKATSAKAGKLQGMSLEDAYKLGMKHALQRAKMGA